MRNGRRWSTNCSASARSGLGSSRIGRPSSLRAGANSVALNLDTIPTDPPFAPMTQIDGTTLWFVTHPFADDDLLDYMLAVDDPMTPLAQETDIVGRVSNHWQPDPLNPTADGHRPDERLGAAHERGAPLP